MNYETFCHRCGGAVLLVCALVLTACDPQSSSETQAASPMPAVPSLDFLEDMAAADAGASAEAAAVGGIAEGEVMDIGPIGSQMSELERLTFALQSYYDDAELPAINSFEPLVKRRLIKSVPVAPPGMKYVIDLKRMEVRLEKE
jgi:hypothetical protein